MQFITCKDFAANKESFTILDVRNEASFNEWHIDGSQNIDVHDKIWSGDFETVKRKFSGLPKDKEIVTICNAGVTSQSASMLLESMGYKTKVLEKGMMGWNSVHIMSEILNGGDLAVKQFIRPGKGCLSYIVASNSTKECIAVDPSQFIAEYTGACREFGLKIIGVVETHVHADHISGARPLANLAGAKYYVSSDDLRAKTEFADLKGIDVLNLGKNAIRVIKTPGHTDGSICLIVNDKCIITGDTLFTDGVGRPDLARDKGSAEDGARKLFSSLGKLKGLNHSIIVLPAHFKGNGTPSMKLGEILTTNKALKIGTEKEFVEYVLANLPEAPPNYEQIKSANSNLMFVPRQMSEQLEFGPNRCSSN